MLRAEENFSRANWKRVPFYRGFWFRIKLPDAPSLHHNVPSSED